jgi:hypothetical protein
MVLGLRAGLAVAVLLCVALAASARAADESGGGAGTYRVVQVENPAYRPNELFLAYEDISSPRFEEVRTQYKLAEVLASEQDELKRILLLRHWVHGRLVVDTSKAVPAGDALVYLAEGPKGAAYSCGHQMVVENAVLNAMGYVARCVLAGAGGKEGLVTGSHGMCEVWSNQLRKWIVVDSEHDAHFEKAGVPLSALEIRDEVIKDDGADVVRVDGPDRAPQPKERDESWGRTPRTYNFVSWPLQGNVHSSLMPRSSAEVVYDDDYWQTHKWYRDGREHWAYAAGYFIPIKQRGWIEWTPNVLSVKAAVKGNTVAVSINSFTPNFKEYQASADGGAWGPVKDSVSLELSKPKHEWRLRALNTMNVPGPEYRLVVERQ